MLERWLPVFLILAVLGVVTYLLLYGQNLVVSKSIAAVEVFLLDQENQPLLKLNRYSSIQRIRLDGKNRYYLHWEFQSATGKCQLRWQ